MRGQQGFTLIEVLVALAILTVVVVTLASGVISNLNAVRNNRDNAAAKAYAQSVLEAYRSTWADAASYAAKTPPNLSGLPALPPLYTAQAPVLKITDVALTDAAGNDITRAKDAAFAQVRQLEITVFKRTTTAVQLSTRISDPSARRKVKE